MARLRILAALTAVFGFAFSQLPAAADTTPDATSMNGPTIVDAFNVSKSYETDLVIGYPDAPITVIEYASLTCPHCAHFHNEVYPTFKKDWIDSGKVRFVYRDFPLDNSAYRSSIAISCLPVTQRPKAISSLFANQNTWPTTSFDEGVDLVAKKQTDPSVDLSSATLGVAALFKRDVDPAVDIEKLKACLLSTEQQRKVAVPALEIRQAKAIEGTPAIFINGKPFKGTRSVETLGKAIQDELASQR